MTVVVSMMYHTRACVCVCVCMYVCKYVRTYVRMYVCKSLIDRFTCNNYTRCVALLCFVCTYNTYVAYTLADHALRAVYRPISV